MPNFSAYRRTFSGFTFTSLLLALVVIAIVIVGIWKFYPWPKPAYMGPTVVRGYIAVGVGAKTAAPAAGSEAETIYVPAVQVTLRDTATNTDSPASVTDLSGRFTTEVAKASTYQLCWKSDQLGSGCLQKPFALSGRFRNLNTVEVPLARSKDGVAIHGTVRRADGTSPRAYDALANINSFARVSLLDEQGKTLLSAAVNNHDQYLLNGVQPGSDYWLRIEQEKYDHRQRLRAASGAPTQRYDFTMNNSAPVIEPLVARAAGGLRATWAAPGAVLTLNARVADRDKDNIDYLWRVSAGSLNSATDPAPTWTLPNQTGRHAAHLIAYDKRGGYAVQSVAVRIDPRGQEFSGRVTGTDVPTIAGATIEVNGQSTATDANGQFRLFVPDSTRYMVNIRKEGYSFASNIYYDAVVGGAWQLTRATVASVDPTKDIEVQNKRDRGDCPGAPSERLDWARHPALMRVHYQDGRGQFVSTPKDIEKLPGLPTRERKQRTECGPGATVQIRANSLVDGNGNAPSGPVDVQISTVDLQSPNQMPGNYSVAQGSSKIGVMQSYGAAIVEIRAGGAKYNLRPGTTAKLIIPVDPGQIAAGGPLAPSIPLLRYDEARGVWKQDGSATLATINGTPSYVATVTHFSALNSDNIKQDQSCIAVQNQNMPANYDLEVTIPQAGNAAPVKRLFTSVTGGNVEHVLLNLPKNTNIVMVPIRTTDPDPNKNQLPMGVFVVNSGAPQNPGWPTVPGGFANEPQGPPYYTTDAGGNPLGPCSTKIILKDLGTQFYPDPSSLLTGAFLHGLGSFAAVNLTDTDPAFAADANQTLRDAVTAASAAYRKAIDPRGLRGSLACFKQTNRMPLKPSETCATAAGFTPQPALAETTGAYANTIDLGFGREMHCVKDGSNVACAVSNYQSLVYTGPGQGGDVSKANAAVDGLNNLIAADATVTMEYSAIEDFAAPGAPVTISDTTRTVKFYVFNGAGQPVDAANLDGLGARPVPQLCMVCHGGAFSNTTGSTTTAAGVPTPVFRDPAVDAAGSRADARLNAKFLPFDLKSFTFPTTAGFTQPLQEAAFKTLNDYVKVAPPPDAADPSSAVITALNDAWYPGGATPQLDVAVPLWNTNPQRAAVYLGAVARACRTCHVSNADPDLRFDRAVASAGVAGFNDKLGIVQLRACKQHVMPHARRTHDLFWTGLNPSQPAQLQAYGDAVKTADPGNSWQRVGDPGVSADLLCGNEYTQGGGVIVTNTAFSPVQTIFNNCTGCHSSGAATSVTFAKLNLATNPHANIVGVDSWELPSMKRITAGSTSNSYLLRKLQNTHTGLGSYQAPGPGVQMPQGGPPLSLGDQTTISNWINGGAQP